MAKASARDEDDGAAAPAKSGGKKVLLIVLGAVLLLGVSIAGTVLVTKSLMGGGEQAESADEENTAAKAERGKAGDKKKKKGDKGDKGDKKAKGEHGEAKPAVYLSLEPPFVVNAEGQGSTHYLQVSMDVMARDPEVIEAVKKHMPVIRNNLIMLLSSQNQSVVGTREGKEKLRAEALTEIQKVLKEQTGDVGVESVYFTIFVMQ
jgi:flagellar FliL protein